MLPRWRAVRTRLCIVVLALASTDCAARRFSPPADPGAPLPNFTEIHAEATASCAGVRTFTAELSLAGRAGSERLRGRVIAGFSRPDSMRLEGVAPFGPPAFVLVSREDRATLVLPRDNAALSDAPPAPVLEALTGVSMGPADLQAVLTGCVSAQPRATAGRQHGDGWASVTTESGAVLYLRQEAGQWRLRAARVDDWWIEYPAWMGRFPATVRLRSDDVRVPVDLSATIAQLETNIDLEAAAFAVSVPDGARRITLDDLRAGGPLRSQP